VACYEVIAELASGNLVEAAHRVGRFEGEVTLLLEAQEEGYLARVLRPATAVEGAGAMIPVGTPIAVLCEEEDEVGIVLCEGVGVGARDNQPIHATTARHIFIRSFIQLIQPDPSLLHSPMHPPPHHPDRGHRPWSRRAAATRHFRLGLVWPRRAAPPADLQLAGLFEGRARGG
jgi:hypothetical protein